ncbi:hypothetical protein K435DRAFT_805623 [Dendrothele bispora CBS 962.96]|uniref:Uncharacterized protein n=1 Tax=Dendrothele bispora (strain CBS 962.96) TaxID=1314807 RepID=A0A4S8LB45_DENBC|nr:hypothetical protein K435DRAFT_805623 [Dendrothele bispora CBS 962.96]
MSKKDYHDQKRGVSNNVFYDNSRHTAVNGHRAEDFGYDNNYHPQNHDEIKNAQDGKLPEKTRIAFCEYFKPALIEFAGCGTAWKDPDSEELQKLWIKVMPNEMKGQYSQFGRGIRELATETLEDWRNSIGEAAITVVEQILYGKNEEERKTFIEGQIMSKYWIRPYYYPENNAERSEEAFQSRIVSETFSQHFEIIKNIPDDSRSKELPKAALVLSILAIDRAFLLSSAESQNGITSGDFSSYQRAKDFSPKIHGIFGKNRSGQDRVTTKMWSQIIAAARAHVEPQNSNISSSILPEDKEEIPDDYLYNRQML